MAFAIGGEFRSMGLLQRWLLEERGLQDGHSIIDVGCGSGRTAHALTDLPKLRYVGIDVVPDLLEYARRLCGRTDWRFEVAQGLRLPAEDGSVDFVVFFSVLTHLLHEESFIYLRDAARVLRPGGRIVFSFLQFQLWAHWGVFQAMIDRYGQNLPLNMFVDPSWFPIWAQHLGLELTEVRAGNEDYIALRHDVTMDSGQVMSGKGSLGQSLCVLRKPG